MTRDDIRKNTNVTKRAQRRYTEKQNGRLIIDDDVPSGTRLASIAPRNMVLEKILVSRNAQQGDKEHLLK